MRAFHGLRAIQFWCFFILVLLVDACSDNSNHPPTASAGADIVTTLGKTIVIDGSGSTDIDGDKLSYTWTIIQRPEKSASELINTNSPKPQLSLDKVGRWLIQLTVNDGKKSSKPDQISITTSNQLPNAKISNVSLKAGAQLTVGETVTLDASSSEDPDKQTLTYNWSIIVKPGNSIAQLSSDTSQQISFVADQTGEYIVHLIVDDGIQQSIPETIVIRVESSIRQSDTIPIAEAGLDRPLYVSNTLVTLDGSKSYDAENDPLIYRWELITKPASSLAILDNSASVTPVFTADILGSYVAKLEVSDRNGTSHNDVVVITPHAQPDLTCQDCHNNSIAQGKSATHILNYDDCNACHNNIDWSTSNEFFHPHGHHAWPPACEVCHNGTNAKSKPTDHLITDLDCNFCHLVSNKSWLPALATPGRVLFEHIGIQSGCTACHDGIKQSTKPEGHVPSSNRCNACHQTNDWLPALHLEHTAALGLCINCHEATKQFRPLTHINTSNKCSACHNEAQWLPVLKVDHNEVVGACATCHNGKIAKGKKDTHPPASSFCDSCHSVQDWKPTGFDHQFITNACVDCHEPVHNQNPLNHFITDNVCENCHTSTLLWQVTQWNHQSVLGGCYNCHNGKVATGKSANHPPTEKICERCHSTVSLTAISFDHNSVQSLCEGCHKIVPKNHFNFSSNCQSCHLSRISWQQNITFKHDSAFKRCDSCHDGINFSGKSQAHYPYDPAADCDQCHDTNTFIHPLKSDHTFFSTDCNSCHTNSIGQFGPPLFKSANHVPTSDQCSACHANYQWAPVLPQGHSAINNGCVSCHNGVSANYKSAGHTQTTTEQCESCHTTLKWQVVTLDHTLVVGACVECHSMRVSSFHEYYDIADCSACHSTVSWVPVIVVDHAKYIEPCVHCHNNIVAGGQSARHIDTLGDCDACHSPTMFAPVLRVNHAATLGSCSSCHNGKTASGKSANHIATSAECDQCHTSAAWRPTFVR